MDNSLDLFRDLRKNIINEINPLFKLHIILEIDNGKSAIEVAKLYGVHPEAVADIYNQKEEILKKCAHLSKMKESSWVILDQELLKWLRNQLKDNILVTEKSLKEKAKQILERGNICVNEWIVDFKKRHNIVRCTLKDSLFTKEKYEWINFVDSLNEQEIYVGGISALHYALDLDDYSKGVVDNNFLSIFHVFNITGSQKLKLSVVGTEAINNVNSIPINYYLNNPSKFTEMLIIDYLNKWNEELATNEHKINLALVIPDSNLNIRLEYINVINLKDNAFLLNTMKKMYDCFKYNYRKIQVIKRSVFEQSEQCLIDYIYMISSAWNNISDKYIKQLFFPPKEGGLVIDYIIEEYPNLSEWYSLHKKDTMLNISTDIVDRFANCDEHLCGYQFKDDNESFQSINEVLENNQVTSAFSGVESYQAMKRLVNYILSEGASDIIMKSAKSLEDHLEVSALVEINEIIHNYY